MSLASCIYPLEKCLSGGSALFVLSFMGSLWAFPGAADGKKSAYNAGDMILILGSGRYSGEGNGNPLQYSCLGNPMDRGAWRAIVHRSQKVEND